MIPDRPLGTTEIACHPLGFGSYRIADGVPEHERALRDYLERGGNLIDTSANYTDGESETLVGRVLEGSGPDRVTVVTKGGYIQGQNMDLAHTHDFPEVVRLAPDLWHCLHPEFLDTQITRSLGRMRLERIDVYLLHNPEYFLTHKADPHYGGRGLAREDIEEFYRRVGEAFAFLEGQVEKGRIRFYGVSSNNFGTAASDATHTSVKRCLDAAGSVSTSNRFKVIQLPMNLYENGGALERNNDGRTVLELCSERGIGVLVNRPLNAFHDDRLIRLADFIDRHGDECPPEETLADALSPLKALEE
ncbi:MAG: aldo/keto reductase, partial [Vicinamibacteria bacterium]